MAGFTLANLNNYMKSMDVTKLVLTDIPNVGLYEALRDRIDRTNLIGDMAKVHIQLGIGIVGRPMTEASELPYPAANNFDIALIPLRRVVDNAGVTKQALDRATGGDASWGSVVELAIDNMRRSFSYLLKLCAFGNGTGALGRISASSESSGTYTLTLDNTYDDFGIENCALIKTGMRVEIYRGDNMISSANCPVVDSTFGNRRNGVATTGTIKITDVTGKTFKDNDVVYLAGAYGNMPMGLTGIVQNGTNYSGVANVTTFQGLARANYPAMCGRVYKAQDFGLLGSGETNGVPTDWDLSVLSDAFQDVADGDGQGQVNLGLVSAKTAMCIQRKNRAENFFGVMASSVDGLQQSAVGQRYATTFVAPDGRLVPIVVDSTIPDNVFYGITTDDLTFFGLGDFDFLREYGDIWEPSRGNRLEAFEAPFGGYINVGATRCDNCFMIQDLRTDV